MAQDETAHRKAGLPPAQAENTEAKTRDKVEDQDAPTSFIPVEQIKENSKRQGS